MMPELPEVESVRRQLDARLRGRLIVAVSASGERRYLDVERAASNRIEAVARRGKFLLLPLRGADQQRLELILHLGMTGSFHLRGESWRGEVWRPDAYVRATFQLDDGLLDFRDVRRFGRLAVVAPGDYQAIPTLALLGPEPLSDDFTPDRFHADLARTRAPVKAALLGQRVVAGVGNIYADEALWQARIHPRARRIGRTRAHRLRDAIRLVLAAAIEREGTTFRDYLMVNGESGRNADFLVAYGRQGHPCPRCSTALRKTVVAGRGTTYCPTCQRG